MHHQAAQAFRGSTLRVPTTGCRGDAYEAAARPAHLQICCRDRFGGHRLAVLAVAPQVGGEETGQGLAVLQLSLRQAMCVQAQVAAELQAVQAAGGRVARQRQIKSNHRHRQQSMGQKVRASAMQRCQQSSF